MGDSKDITDETSALAACYALGVLEGVEAAGFERLIQKEPAVAAEVASFQEVAENMAYSAPLQRPAAHVKDRLFARLQPVQKSKTALMGVVIRGGEQGWVKTPFPGVEVKRLFVDPVTGMITTMLRAAAGAVYPAHEHGGFEQVYVVDGDMIFNDHTLDTGDYEASAGNTRHSSIETTEGCLALIIHSPDDKVLPE